MPNCPQCGSPIAGDAGSLCPGCPFEVGLEDIRAERKPSAPDDGDSFPHFGPYGAVRVLGEGGMGVVYLIRSSSPDRM